MCKSKLEDLSGEESLEDSVKASDLANLPQAGSALRYAGCDFPPWLLPLQQLLQLRGQ
jgi:hypothetical protein